MKKSLLLFIIVVLIVFSLPGGFVKSDIIPSSRGTDFWLCFPPNFHSSSTDDHDSLYIFIAADSACSGTITYKNRNGQNFTQNFTIANPAIIYSFHVYYTDFELAGYNNSGTNWSRNQDEQIALQSFHVVSTKVITVYGHSQASMTSDAFLVLPTNVLGTDYFVMAYNSDVYSDGNNRTPSQFAIVASQDSTKITIKPTCETYANSHNTQNITLNKGQCYLVQAKIPSAIGISDLTGTDIRSNKPIALFGSQQRSTIPWDGGIIGPSRDFVIEEMPPIPIWGNNAFLVPYPQDPQQYTTGLKDVYRILVAYDNTTIFINGTSIITLNAGQFYENDLTNPATVTASAPILLAQYKKTAGNNTNANGIGDPFMMLVPPKQQFLNAYKVINIQATQSNIGLEPAFIDQYISVIVPSDAINSLVMVGETLPTLTWVPIPNSNYSYANIKTIDGIHALKASKEFGIFIYGYGHANSYGYIGGMGCKFLDFNPPQIFANTACYTLTGMVYDTAKYDSQIIAIEVPVANQNNVTVNVSPFTPPQPSVAFSAQLVNKRQDGQFIIVAHDSIGYTTTKTINIPGYTLYFEDAATGIDTSAIIAKLKTHSTKCYDFIIVNKGKFPQKIDSIVHVNHNEFTVTYKGNGTVPPGGKDTVQICFYSTVDSVYYDTLTLFTPCEITKILSLEISAGLDKKKPVVYSFNDTCHSKYNFTFTDSSVIDVGIQTINILEKKNCTIQTNFTNAKVAYVNISIDDPMQDAIFSISVADSSKNITIVTDTVPGFTISYAWHSQDSSSSEKDFGVFPTGSLKCDTLELYDYGMFPFTFNNILILHNINFSLPQSQFPLIIPPGERKNVQVYFHPSVYENHIYYDTLLIPFNCVIKTIPLKGTSVQNEYNGQSTCDNPMMLIGRGTPFDFFVEQNYPNPAVNKIKIVFGIPSDSQVDIILYDSFGERLKTLTSGYYNTGIYEISGDLSDLASGCYYYRMMASGRNLTKSLILTK